MFLPCNVSCTALLLKPSPFYLKTAAVPGEMAQSDPVLLQALLSPEPTEAVTPFPPSLNKAKPSET